MIYKVYSLVKGYWALRVHKKSTSRKGFLQEEHQEPRRMDPVCWYLLVCLQKRLCAWF